MTSLGANEITQTRRITVTKLDAARRQLDTAIELSFTDGDPISIHVLAYSSYEIVHRLFRRAGFKDDLVFDTALLPEDHRGTWNKMIKEAPNFFKHCNRGEANETISFFPGYADLFMITSLHALKRIGCKLNRMEMALTLWALIHLPGAAHEQLITERGKIVEQMDYLRSATRSKFFAAFQRASKKQV